MKPLLTKLDWYIIRKFLGTFALSIVLVMSVAVVFDITEKMVNFFSDMMAQPLYGIRPGEDEMPDYLSSSRKGMLSTQHTNFLLVRTPRSTLSRRNWDPSLIVDKSIWKYSDDEDDNNDYPKKWDESLEKKTAAKDPNWSGYKVKKPYSRSSTFTGWSGKAIQEEE